MVVNVYTVYMSALTDSIFVATGEHQDEGDHRKRAENEATSAGVTQSPEGKTLCVSLFYSCVSHTLTTLLQRNTSSLE